MTERLWLTFAGLLLWSTLVLASEQFVLEVDGLACPFCAYGIEKRLSSIDGVLNVNTDIKRGRVVVTMTDGKTLTEAAASEAVEDAGFTLRGFSSVSPGGTQ